MFGKKRGMFKIFSRIFFLFFIIFNKNGFVKNNAETTIMKEKFLHVQKKFLIRYSQFCVIVSKADQCDTIVNFKYEDEKIVDFL